MYDTNLTLDLICFENTLLNSNIDVFEYLSDKYSYVPSINAIMRINCNEN